MLEKNDQRESLHAALDQNSACKRSELMISSITQLVKAEFLVLNAIKKNVGSYLDTHPTVNKVVVVASHLIRLIPMVAFMQVMPFSLLTNGAIITAASLFYSAAIERFCKFRFSMAANFGAIAVEIAKYSLPIITSGLASSSVGTFSKVALSLAPLALYAFAVLWVSNNDVNGPPTKACCSPKK